MWTCAFDSTRPPLPYGKGGGFNRSAHSAGPGIFETRVQAEIEATANKAPQEQWQNQDRRYEICFKMDAKAEVMSNRPSKVGHFPLSRQNILLFAQHKAEMSLEKWWFLGQFGYGKIFLHTIFAKIVLRKCASYRGRGAHFHKFCEKNKENPCQQASNINRFEGNYGDSKNELKILIAKQP